MIQLTNNRLLAFFCFVLSVGVFTACKKNTDAKSDKIELFSFGPTGAKHGDTLRFVGTNLDQVTAIHFTGSNAVVEKAAFKQQSAELILAVVPATAEKGYVTLKTPQGDVVSKTIFNLSVKATANVTNMTKQARPGENITLTGNSLHFVRKVTFSRDKVVTSFVSQTVTQLVVKVPDDAQTGPLVLSYTGTDSLDAQTADTLKVTLPMATSLSPTPIKHQNNLTITGTDLDLVKQVLFQGVSTPVTTFVSQSATQLVVKVPAGTVKGKVVLVAASGVQTSSPADLDVVLPTITSFSPNPIDPSTNLTITGTNLDLVSSVTFANAAAVTTFVSQSPTQIVVKLPATAAASGKVTLGVLNSTVTVQSATDLALVLPTITTMAPNPVDPNSNVTITGTLLDRVTSVTFSNAPAVTTFVSQSPTQIVVKVPAGVLRGKITLGVANSTATVLSADVLEINGAVPPPTIAFPIYNDAITANWTTTGWIGGGWGGTKDLNNTSPVREGSKSVKIDYVGGYGSPLQLGHNAGAGITITPYTTFKVSIYGAAGSGGKKVNIGINGADKFEITIVEGRWTDYSIPLSTLTTTSQISEILIKEYSGTGGFTIYVDALGLN